MTTWVDLVEGDLVEVSEIGGDFETRAEVRGAYEGSDRIPRLNLEFMDRKAPPRLVGTGEMADLGGARGTPRAAPAHPEPAPSSDSPTTRTSVAAAAALAAEGGPGAATVEEEADRQSLRDEVLSVFQSLRTISHYELLAIPREADMGAIRAAYARRARRFHPDRATRDLTGLRSAFEAILVRLGEARELLEDEGRRRYYDAHLGPSAPASVKPQQNTWKPPSVSGPRPVPKPRPVPEPPPVPEAEETGTETEPAPSPPESGNAEADVVRAEKEVAQARRLFAEEKYWDAIRLLEAAMVRTQSPKLKLTMRVIWARSMSKNPRWLRRAEEALLDVIKEDPRHVEAHYELGQIYSAGGLTTRAQRMYRRVLELETSHRGAAAALNSLLTTRRL
jgi:hypothetical protein